MVLNKISIVSNYNNITNKDCIEDSKDTGNRNKGIKYLILYNRAVDNIAKLSMK